MITAHVVDIFPSVLPFRSIPILCLTQHCSFKQEFSTTSQLEIYIYNKADILNVFHSEEPIYDLKIYLHKSYKRRIAYYSLYNFVQNTEDSKVSEPLHVHCNYDLNVTNRRIS